MLNSVIWRGVAWLRCWRKTYRAHGVSARNAYDDNGNKSAVAEGERKQKRSRQKTILLINMYVRPPNSHRPLSDEKGKEEENKEDRKRKRGKKSFNKAA